MRWKERLGSQEASTGVLVLSLTFFGIRVKDLCFFVWEAGILVLV